LPIWILAEGWPAARVRRCQWTSVRESAWRCARSLNNGGEAKKMGAAIPCGPHNLRKGSRKGGGWGRHRSLPIPANDWLIFEDGGKKPRRFGRSSSFFDQDKGQSRTLKSKSLGWSSALGGSPALNLFSRKLEDRMTPPGGLGEPEEFAGNSLFWSAATSIWRQVSNTREA